jgi:hypothetical protein
MELDPFDQRGAFVLFKDLKICRDEKNGFDEIRSNGRCEFMACFKACLFLI